MKEKIVFIILLIFQFCLGAYSDEKTQLNADYILKHNKPKEIIVYDLQVLNNPYLPYIPLTDNTKLKSVEIPFIQKIDDPFFMNYRSIWVSGKFDVDEPDRLIMSDLHGSTGLYGVRLGLVSGPNIVYINDKLIGKFESMEIDKLVWPSSYLLPVGLLLKKTNKIDIRFITSRKYLTLISDIEIQNKKSYLQSEKWNNFLYNQLPMGFCILFIGIIITLLYNLIVYKVKRYFFFTLYLLSQLISLLLVYSPTSFLDFDSILLLTYVLIPVNLLIFILIYQSLFSIYLWKHNIITALIILPISVFIFARTNILNELDTSLIIIFFIQVIIYIYLIYMIRVLNSLKRDTYIFNLCVLLYSLSLILDLIQGFGIAFNIWYHHFYFIYSSPFFLLLIINYEVKVNKRKRAELEKLENKFLRNNPNNNNTLTESAERKIEKILAFLNENFTEDISREGLASVIDMNPNYMGKLFYQHTGKKINEYINHLRINDAARQLTESSNGRKVIDIALAVGFDSLSTFNRAFKNIFDLTPTEYKRKNSVNTA